VSAIAVRGGLVGVAGSTDHKRVAVRIAVTAAAFFAAGGAMALLMRAELAEPGLQVVSTGTYNALFTMHGSTMIYLVITPFALALGLYLVPLQVGAGGIAGARWALAGWWLYALGGLSMYSGFLTRNGAAAATWGGFDPLSNAVNSPGEGMDLWILGVALATAGELLWGLCILRTVLRGRAPTMTMLRMPVFTWAMTVTSLMVIFAFPVLIAAMGLLWYSRQWGGVFDGPAGPVAYQHLFWFYGHPVVYVMFFPYVGAVAECVATFSGRRFFGYTAMVASLLLFTSLSMSVWAHHMFTIEGVTVKYFSLTSIALVVPAGMEYFDMIGTLWGGAIRLTTAMLFALGFLVQFLIGGLTGVWVGSSVLDYHVNNSYFVVAHFHYTLFGGSFFGLMAAVYLWWPKVTGCLLREGLGRLHFALSVLGANLTFFPMFFLGRDGMTRRVADYPSDAGWSALNAIASVGAACIALSLLVFAVNVAVSLRRPVPAGDDPWGGHTLEWATRSPPPRHNFADPLPPVRSHAPLLDLNGTVPVFHRGEGGTDPVFHRGNP
jgi:cytochrome c oxidase subunit I